MKNLLAALCGILLALTASLTTLAFLLDGVGGSASLMHSLMAACAPPETTGLPQEHYPAITEMITDYLSGRAGEFQFSYADAQGVNYLCFNAKEQQHMADVKALFDLDRSVMLGASLLLAMLGLGAFALRRHRRHIARGAVWGVLTVLLVLTGAAVWATVDFDSLFVLFHRLSFTNDLWLLDPRTDLLIRLMPIDFFIRYAAILGGTWLGTLVIMLAAAHRLSSRWKQ